MNQEFWSRKIGVFSGTEFHKWHLSTRSVFREIDPSWSPMIRAMSRRGRAVLRKVLPHEEEEEEEEKEGEGEEEEEETEPRTLFSGATRTTKSLSKNLFTSRFGSYSVSRCCFAPRQGDLYSTRVTWAVWWTKKYTSKLFREQRLVIENELWTSLGDVYWRLFKYRWSQDVVKRFDVDNRFKSRLLRHEFFWLRSHLFELWESIDFRTYNSVLFIRQLILVWMIY